MPREEVAERVKQALQKLSPGAVAQALEAKNVWQSLKAIASKPSTMFRWIRPDELEQHIQQRASDQFGVSVVNPKAKKQGGGRAKASSKPLQVDPMTMQMASGSVVSSGSDHLCQLAFEEVVAEAECLAFCHASQLAPFLADYRPLSVGALGVLTTSPIPVTSCGTVPVSTVRYSALYAPTGEAILLTGTLLQLGDSTLQLASGWHLPCLCLPGRAVRGVEQLCPGAGSTDHVPCHCLHLQDQWLFGRLQAVPARRRGTGGARRCQNRRACACPCRPLRFCSAHCTRVSTSSPVLGRCGRSLAHPSYLSTLAGPDPFGQEVRSQGQRH